MSHPPTDPVGWNQSGWPPPDNGGEAAGQGRPPGQRPGLGGWSAPNAQQPTPRVYGRATPTASNGGQQTPPDFTYGQQPPPASTYGRQPPPASTYGRQTPPGFTYGQPSPASTSYGRPTYPTSYEPPPASAPPAYPAAAPDPAAAPEPPVRFGRFGKPQKTLVLAVVAALLLVLGGIMTGLFFSKSSELSRAERELAAKVEQVEKLNRDVKAANDRAAKTQQDLTGTQNSRKEVERQKQVIARCLTLLVEVGQAANNGDRSAYEEAYEQAQKVCQEADRYL